MESTHNPPDEFYTIINDFVTDIKYTFPEYTAIIDKWWRVSEYLEIEDSQERENKVNKEKNKRTKLVYVHCTKVFPERFFDILYQNVEIFQENSEVNTQFLPGIVFSHMWNSDISDKTKETIWKYLQLIVFSVIGSVNNPTQLGDTAKLFEAIDEEELKNKLKETMENMCNLFEHNQDNETDETPEAEEESKGDKKPGSSFSPDNLPDVEELHNHINKLMDGKLGKLAMELAEETANDLDFDLENVKNPKDIFEKLFKNPTKFLKIISSVGSKLDSKIKSGELKESEIVSEGIDLLNKMKGVPGMKNMEQLFSQFGMGNMGKGAKFNMGAMKSQMSKNLQKAKMKEKLQAKNTYVNNNNSNNFTDKINEIQKKIVTDEAIIEMFNDNSGSTTGKNKTEFKKGKNSKKGGK